jgi:hypothetical protein
LLQNVIETFTGARDTNTSGHAITVSRASSRIVFCLHPGQSLQDVLEGRTSPIHQRLRGGQRGFVASTKTPIRRPGEPKSIDDRLDRLGRVSGCQPPAVNGISYFDQWNNEISRAFTVLGFRPCVIASLSQVRITDAGWTSPPVTVKSHSSCVPLVHRLLLGRIRLTPFDLCPASKRHLIML